jgi:hypothetical protein
MEWMPISTAPFDPDVEVASVGAVHALSFRCRRTVNGWVNAESKDQLNSQVAT